MENTDKQFHTNRLCIDFDITERGIISMRVHAKNAMYLHMVTAITALVDYIVVAMERDGVVVSREDILDSIRTTAPSNFNSNN